MIMTVDKKIVVLQTLDSLGVGGAEQLVLTLCKGLNKDMFNVVVCTLFSRDPQLPEPLADEIRALGIRVEQMAMTRWRDLKTITRFLRIIDEENIDIVHSHMIPANFWGTLLAKVFKKRLTVYTCHEPFLHKGLAMRLQQSALNMFLSDKIISISEMTTKYLTDVCYASIDNIVKIPNAVDTDRFNPFVAGTGIRTSLGIPEHVPVIANVGRYTPEKGYPFFLETAGIIAKQFPESRFLIVGRIPDPNPLAGLIKKLEIGKNVIFTGPRRDIPEILGAVDVFLFTSIWGEGFGISLIEAMACGKPIVASNIGPTMEIIEDKVTGLLPTPKVWIPGTDNLNVKDLADACMYLLKNPEIGKRLGSEARRQAVKRFSVPAWIKSIEDTYCSMIKNRLKTEGFS